MTDHEAAHYRKLENAQVRCDLCPHRCAVADGGRGKCDLRENRGGVLYALSYGQTVTASVDPIEKKPLFHFLPGSVILSIGPNGCTLACDNCQNWHISQELVPTHYLSPEELVRLAGKDGSIGVAFTYTEPLLWFEYLRDVLPLLRERGFKSILVTNGFLNEEPAREIAPLVDAMNVDLKSIRDTFYKDVCGGRVEPVKRFIEIAAAACHVEVTNLVIPALNDRDEDFRDLASWLAGISREIPLHLSRFFPQFRMEDVPPTPVETLERAYRIAREHLAYVYVGNISIEGTSDTHCPRCGEIVVSRAGYSATLRGPAGRCPACAAPIKGVWK